MLPLTTQQGSECTYVGQGVTIDGKFLYEYHDTRHVIRVFWSIEVESQVSKVSNR